MEQYLRNLFLMSVLLYVLGAAASALIYFFKKPYKTSMTGSVMVNAVCIVASGLGGAASAAKILLAVNSLKLINLSSTIPFISLEMNLDNLSAYFVLALSVLVFCVSLYSIGYLSHYNGKRNIGLFNLLYTLFILAMIGVLTSANTVCFYIFWEAMSLLSYFLVVFESEKEENTKAGTVYIVMTHIATALLLIGFIIIYSYTKSFALSANTAAIPGMAKNIVFILFLIGFGTKAGIIPLHIWLPHAHPAAPSNVSALMSGIMIKTAIYGLVRFVLCYLGVQNTWWGVVILILGILSAVLGVAYTSMEHNVKRLLAFCSVENIGIILIGLGVSFIAFALHHQIIGSLALTAALLHTFNHTLFKGGLFLGAGAIQYATHTKNIEDLGGLIKTMPLTALFFLCFSLAISAIVPFNGFISEWLTYQSLFASILPGHIGLNFLAVLAAAALALTGAMAAAAFVKLFGISFLGLPRSEQAAKAQDVPATMMIGMGILAALCLGIGLFPLTMIKLLDKVVFSVGGGSISGQLRGGFLLAYYPLTISVNSISPLTFMLALGVIILLAFIVIRIVGGKYIERRYGTWDCGFEALNSRTQYSATGFSKPIKIVFRALFRPIRKTIVEGDSQYHPEAIIYSTTVTSIFEDYLYEPVYRALLRFSRRTKFRVQTGSIHNYLFYIFALVLLLMLYNRFA
ncbi:hydrogenase-4 component B [Desulfosporosinus acididurans]|uniref:Hydrogenase-4 component B n=1 Tax=Desulfosporosinus acididurans TaxID=476652 RepID=A0A0J1FVL4_9FIRM|nr:proton-conducting transporter membrane subunit [Desulfosporosinus acididurans]KLU67347.1 hydrogenase-4 component B [Desulfosporosinus acididurans]